MVLLTDEDVLLNFREAQQFLRASRSKVYRLVTSGELVGHKVGRNWLFYKSELKQFVERHRSPSLKSDGGHQ